MRALDTAVLARLATSGVDIIDGAADWRPDPGSNVVTYDLPYAVYTSSVGDDDEDTRRVSAHIPRDSMFIAITYVGLDRNQTKWAGEKLHGVLRRWRPVVAGYRIEVVRMLEAQRIWRDDEAVRPDGSPLFYGVSHFAVGFRKIT